MRGPVAPPQVPLSVSRAVAFDDLVQDSADRLRQHWPQLADIVFLTRDVPDGRPAPGAGDTVPLGLAVPARDGSPGCVVVYRRPVEIRAKGRDERSLLVHDVVVEQAAELLGLSPETVDPRYGQDD